jgi:hypothetical protein
MKNLINHLHEEWYKYLLEIIVITAGILGAFALNSWKEERKSKIFEREMLIEIKSALKSDLRDLKFNELQHSKALQSQKIIIDWIESNKPYQDSLCNHFGLSNTYTVFLSNDGPYQTLKAVGINLISNDSIRDLLRNLYGHRYNWINDVEAELIKIINYKQDHVDSQFFINGSIDASEPDFFGCQQPIEPSALRNSTVYGYHLRRSKEFNEIFIKIMNGGIRMLDGLIDQIDVEISKT